MERREEAEHNLSAIRGLLLAAFQPENLRRFCQDRPMFRPIIDTFGPGQGFDAMVDRVIDYCASQLLFRELLVALQTESPRQYARFAPYENSRVRPPTPAEVKLWAENLEKYKKGMAQRYGTTQIFGQPRPVPLDQVFTDVYILEKPAAFRRFDIQQLKQDPDLLRGEKRLPGSSLVMQPVAHRLFILGRPGAGKTTFLKHLVLETARGNLDKVPVFVTLKEWADAGQDILPFIVQQFALCGLAGAGPFVEHLLRETDTALVLLDGLDEVPRENDAHQRAIRAMKGLAEQYPRAQCLVTCRTAATDHTFEGFRYVEVADFAPEQIETLVRKWFHVEPDKGETFLAEINRAQNRGLLELARTPLLLAMLCLAFNETLRFPIRRVEIYQDALEALLRKWDSSRSIRRDEVYRALSPGRKQQLFTRIAAESFERAEYFLPQAKLERQIEEYMAGLSRADLGGTAEIDARQVLRSIEAQHGILVERAHGIYSFAHLTFQEYYAARYVAENATPRTFARLLEHCTDARWREVILLAASLLNDAGEFFVEFRRALDRLMAPSDRLAAMAQWAAERAARTRGECSEAEARAYHWSLAMDVDLLQIINGDLARDLARVCALAYARNLAGALAIVIDLGCDLAGALGFYAIGEINVDRIFDLASDPDRAFYSDLDLALEFASDPDRALEMKEILPSALWTVVNNMVGVGCAVGNRELAADLRALESVKDDPDRIARELRAVADKHCHYGHDAQWDEGEARCLCDYLDANGLLLECLDLAYVSNRQAVEDSLLLPPGMWQPEDFTR